ncbi:MAG TPA: LuxR C-terminal-related transcriptional regulator, partial [Propionibacteriaceae bacterium]|nr:LuxR C-terminal-related transcriptional regulator [Propionibacteriaceae bacterium]
TQVRVGLVYGTYGIAVIVEDDGIGFEPDSVPGDGVGLPGLVARATQVGGRVRIDSTPGWGTRIRADLPFRASANGNAPAPRLRVVVLHPLPAMRSGLVKLLDQSEPGVQVVAEVGEGAAAVEAVRLLRPDVVVAGTALPEWSATDLVSALRAACPRAGVVAVVDPGTAQELRELATAGVQGVVPSDVDATNLGRAVVGVARGDVLVYGGVLAQLGGMPAVEDDGLTDREVEVRGLLHQGLADKQIASRLGISVKTVEKHVSAILRKHGVRSRTELMARA